MERRALKRAWIPPSRVAAEPRIHTSPSLPLGELVRDGRPLFECSSCGFSHDRGLPMCLWCHWSDIEVAREWAAKAPRPRTISAPSSANRPLSSSLTATTTIPAPDNATTTKPSSMPNPSSPMQTSFSYIPPNSASTYHAHEHTTRPNTRSYTASNSPTSRPSTPDSGAPPGQPKFAAYVARKTAQRHSMLARLSVQASAVAVDTPRPDTPPLHAPTPGAIALGILLPIPGALAVASRRTSVASTTDWTRESSRLSFSSSSLGHSRSSVDHGVVRPSVDSTRRSYYTAGLAPHSESDDDVEGSPAPVHQQKAAKRFSGLLKRVSSAVRLTGAFTGAKERRLFPVTWGKAR